MERRVITIRFVAATLAGAGLCLGGCAMHPIATVAGAGGVAYRSTGSVARNSAHAGWDTLGQTYNGMGGAISAPLRDFNVVRLRTAPVLSRARKRTYDTRGLNSCQAVLTEVSALDVVLGPDLDTPDVGRHHNMYGRGADMAASTALDAVRSAADHFIPMRGTIRKISGADRAEKKKKSAELAGQIRRGFLKSYGMEHNCAWPAAPIGFEPAPGGPVWPTLLQAGPAPIAPVTPAVIPAAVPLPALPAATAPLRLATAGASAHQTGTAATRPPASAAEPSLATETQAGAWRIGHQAPNP